MAIQAQFVDFKNVKTRSVMQIIFEVDINQAQQVLSELGYPDNSKDIPVGIARITPQAAKEQTKKEAAKTNELHGMINDPLFSTYVVSIDSLLLSKADCKEWVKRKINIESATELIEGSEAYERFKVFRDEFSKWKRAQDEGQRYDVR